VSLPLPHLIEMDQDQVFVAILVRIEIDLIRKRHIRLVEQLHPERLRGSHRLISQLELVTARPILRGDPRHGQIIDRYIIQATP